MAVYVDELRTYPTDAIQPAARRWGNRWCHLIADSLEELHEFAQKLNLRRQWFQSHDARPWVQHYDLLPSKRRKAVQMGAGEITTREWILRHFEVNAHG